MNEAQFDATTVALTATVTAVVTTLVNEPLRAGMRWIFSRLFHRASGSSLETLEAEALKIGQQRDRLKTRIATERERRKALADAEQAKLARIKTVLGHTEEES